VACESYLNNRNNIILPGPDRTIGEEEFVVCLFNGVFIVGGAMIRSES
jgi:hypothetical protein